MRTRAYQLHIEVEADLAVLDEDHPVRDSDRFGDVVGHQQHSEAMLLPQALDQLLHLDAGQRIQRAQWLVEQQQTWAVDQRAGQRHTLLLPAGQRCRPLMATIRQTNRRQGFLGLLAPVAGKTEADVRRVLIDARAARSEANDIRSTITVDAGTQKLDRPEASPIVAAVKKLTATA